MRKSNRTRYVRSRLADDALDELCFLRSLLSTITLINANLTPHQINSVNWEILITNML